MVGSGSVRGLEAVSCGCLTWIRGLEVGVGRRVMAWKVSSPIGCRIYKTVLPAICCPRCVCQSSVMSPCSRFRTAVPWPISPPFVNA